MKTKRKGGKRNASIKSTVSSSDAAPSVTSYTTVPTKLEEVRARPPLSPRSPCRIDTEIFTGPNSSLNKGPFDRGYDRDQGKKGTGPRGVRVTHTSKMDDSTGQCGNKVQTLRQGKITYV